MATGKRKYAEDSTEELYSNKVRSKPSTIARVDPTYGQRSAIPLDEGDGYDPEDGELLYDEEMDALAYLRSVRREAEGIPNLIVAPRPSVPEENRDLYEDGVGDFRGHYEDGAFYAGPDDSDEDAESVNDVQARYFTSILTRFQALRLLLHKTPPLEALQKLDDDHPIYLGRLTASKAKWWRWRMKTTHPLPAQVAAMDKETVLGLLKLMTGGNLLSRGVDIQVGTSSWAWSLLAKLPERGALGSEEIGLVRDLGKKAVLVGIWLKEGERWDEGLKQTDAEADVLEDEDEYLDNATEGEGIEDGTISNEVDDDEDDMTEDVGNFMAEQAIPTDQADIRIDTKSPTIQNHLDTTEGGEPDDLAAAKARMLNLLGSSVVPTEESQPKLAPELVEDDAEAEKKVDASSQNEGSNGLIPARVNSSATVDMILTIAGEIYGQRDLLEFRGFWDQTNEKTT